MTKTKEKPDSPITMKGELSGRAQGSQTLPLAFAMGGIVMCVCGVGAAFASAGIAVAAFGVGISCLVAAAWMWRQSWKSSDTQLHEPNDVSRSVRLIAGPSELNLDITESGDVQFTTSEIQNLLVTALARIHAPNTLPPPHGQVIEVGEQVRLEVYTPEEASEAARQIEREREQTAQETERLIGVVVQQCPALVSSPGPVFTAPLALEDRSGHDADVRHAGDHRQPTGDPQDDK